MSMSKNKIPCSHLLNRNIIIIINMLYYHTYYNSEKKIEYYQDRWIRQIIDGAL